MSANEPSRHGKHDEWKLFSEERIAEEANKKRARKDERCSIRLAF